MKKIKVIGLVLLSIIAGLVFLGLEEAQGTTVTIDRGEVIEDNYLFAGMSFENNGTIDGSIFAVGETVVIGGTVKGNAFIAGNTLKVNGNVEGDIFASGMNIIISGEVNGNVFASGGNVTLLEGAEIHKDLYITASYAVVDGEVLRSAYIGGSDVKINGEIGRDLYVDAESVQLYDESVKGEVYEYATNENAGDSLVSTLLQRVFTFTTFIFSTLVIWLLVTFVARDKNRKLLILTGKKKVVSTIFLFGLLGLVLSFIIPLVLLVSVVGVKIGIAAILLNVVLIYLSVGVAIVGISNVIGKHNPTLGKGKNILIVLILALIIGFLRLIPFISIFVTIPLVLLGYGLIIRSFSYNLSDNKNEEVEKIEE